MRLKDRILVILEENASFCLDNEDERLELAETIADEVEEHQGSESEEW